jgi:hypothetical protein
MNASLALAMTASLWVILTPRASAAQAATTESQSATTEATRSVEQTPAPSLARRAERLRVARAACRDSRRVDAFGVAAIPVLAVAGVSLSIVGFTTPDTPERPRGPTTFFLNAFAPGLVLGAIGVPLGRGWLGGVDPLHTACDTVLDHEDPSDADIVTTEGMLRAYGGPPSIVLPVLMGSATVAVAGGLTAAFLLPNRDLAQAMGGIAAAVVAGWALVPPTPNASAARGFVRGRDGASTRVAFNGSGLSLFGSF